MSRKPDEIPEECFSCPLLDCFPTDPRCPVYRRKIEEKGGTLPPVGETATMPRGGVRKYDDIAPTEYTDTADYWRQYHRNYGRRFKKILVRGVFLRRSDLETLKAACVERGTSLEGEILKMLEGMLRELRSMK